MPLLDAQSLPLFASLFHGNPYRRSTCAFFCTIIIIFHLFITKYSDSPIFFNFNFYQLFFCFELFYSPLHTRTTRHTRTHTHTNTNPPIHTRTTRHTHSHTLTHTNTNTYPLLHTRTTGHPLTHRIQGAMGEFLILLSDSDLEVRRSSLLMVNAATHHHPHVIIPFLREQVNLICT